MTNIMKAISPPLAMRFRTAGVVFLTFTMTPLAVSTLCAAPQGGEIVGGAGSITSPSLNSTVINQTTQSMAINWQSFDVAKDERVEFVQPSATASVLNRIQGQSPSQIFGAIDANGKVFLINPHGILFGKTATVNVGSLVASGLSIDSDAFMKGDMQLSALNGTEGGVVINQGVIQAATGGSVTLVGSSVQNEGIIVARMGSINLGVGNTAVIDFDGDGLMRFEVSGEVQQKAQQVTDAVSNSGTLSAEGGHVAITAHAARDVFTNVINNTGVIKATRIDKDGGSIRLTGQGGSLVSSGRIDASSDTVGIDGGTIELISDEQTVLTDNSITTARSVTSNGGRVHVLGNKVGLFDLAQIDVSGATGGGTALVGGDFQGKNPAVLNADYTYIGENTVINASATKSGDGGQVVVWANEAARYYGSIIARGGFESGNGGLVEVSGKSYLRYDGIVDVSAPMGLSGTLLLDPDDLCITNGGVGSCAGAAEDNVAPFNAATGGSNSYILVSTLQGLGDVNIDLLADDDIIFDANVDLSASLTSATLTLNADNDADGIGGISMAGFDLSTGGGNVTLNVNAAGEGITNIGTTNTGGGTLTLNAAGAMSQNVGDIITGTTRLVKQGNGTLTLTEANDYTGSTTIENGIISISADANLGAAPGTATASHLVLNGGTLASTADMSLNQNRGVELSGAGTIDVATGTTLTYNGVIAGAGGTLSKSNAGNLSLGGNNTYTTATHINGGTLTISADANLGAAPGTATASHLVLNGGTLASTADMSLNQNRGVELSGAGTFDVATGTILTYNGVIAGAGGTLNKSNAGNLSLGGNNTYTTATHINGGTLTISADANLGAAPGTATASHLVLNGGTLASTADMSLNQNRGVELSGAGTFDVATGTTLTYNGVIAGAGGTLNKSNAGNLSLGGNNTYTTATHINGGTLTISDDANLGAAPGTATASHLVLNGGTLASTADMSLNQNRGVELSGAGTVDVATGTTLTYNGVIAGAGGTLNKSNAGNLSLGGNNTYTTATHINGGTLTISDDANLGAAPGTATASHLVLNGGTLASTADMSLNQNRGVELSGAGTVDVATGTTLTYNGVIAGAGGTLSKSNAGNLSLGGNNTYTTATHINGGTLSISDDANLGAAPGTATASHLVLNGGTLASTADMSLNQNRGVELSGAGTVDVATGTTLTYNGIIAGAGGTLSKSNAGNLSLGGNNTYTTATHINGGTLTISDDANLGAAPGTATASHLVLNGGTLASTADMSLNQNRGVELSGAGTIDVATGTTLTYNGVIAGAGGTLSKSNAGNLSLGGNNTYTTATHINGGTLTISDDANLGAAPGTATASHLVLNGGTLASTADMSLNQNRGVELSGAGTVDVATGTTLTYNGVITGAGGTLSKSNAGNLSLGGNNTYTTATHINGGTLSISDDANLGAAPGTATASHLVLNGGTLASTADMSLNQNRGVELSGAGTFDVATGTTLTYNGVIAGAGGNLSKSNAGELTLGGNNTYTTATNIDAGTLSLGASDVIANASTVSVNGGAFNLNGHSDTVASLTVNNGSVTTSTGTLTTINDLATSGASAMITATTGSLIVGGKVDLSNGTLLAPDNTGTFSVAGNWNNTGATVTHNNGTVVLVGTTTQSIASGGQAFNNLTASGSGNVQLQQALTIDDTLSNSAGDFDTAEQTLNATNLAVSGGSINSAGDDNGSWNIGNLNISGTGAVTATTGDFNVSGDWNNNGGSFNHNNGTLVLNGASTQRISSGGSAFNNLTASGAGNVQLLQDLTVEGTLNNSAGDFDTAAQSVNAANLTVAGGSINNAGDDTGNWDIGNLTINTPGSLTATSGNLHVSGDWENNGTFNHNNGTVVFDDSANQTIVSNTGPSNENAFFNVEIDKTGNGLTFSDRVTINSLATTNAAYDISFEGDNSIVSTATVFNNTGNLVLGNDGDDITFSNGATHTSGETSINGTVAATAGDLQFGTTRLIGRLSADAGTINTAALSALGTGDTISAINLSTGDITIADANNVNLSGTTVDTGTVSGTAGGALSNISISATGTATIAGAIATDMGTVTTMSDTLSLQSVETEGKQQYAANEIQLNGDLTGGGELVLQTLDSTQNIELAGGGASTALDLTTSELALLKEFSDITIGRSDSTGTITVMAGETVNVTDSLNLVAGRIDVTGATIVTNNKSLSLTSLIGNIALGKLDAGTGDVSLVVAGNVSSDGTDPNISAKNLRVEGSGASLLGSFASPMNLSGITDTATFVQLKEAHTDGLPDTKIIEGKNINIDNLSTAERIGTGQASGLAGINFIDPALFSADFSLFGVDQSGLKLPSDQLEEE